MQLTDEFRVPVSRDQAWQVLTDLERIAPCMPGAELREVEGDEYRGVVKVKVGPISVQYQGVARFVERDEAAYRAVVRAEGREVRGQGAASATITATLAEEDENTVVKMVTDLSISGKVAQFGRGVMADISSELLGEFARRLEADVLGGSSTAEQAPTSEASSTNESPDAATGTPPQGVRKIQSPSAEPIDLLSAAGKPVFARMAQAAAVVGVLAFITWLLRRGRRSSRS